MNMSIDWNELKKVLKDVDFVLREDLESLKKESGGDLNELWDSVKSAWTTYRREYAPRVDKDVDESLRSRFKLAQLMIATAIHLKELEGKYPHIADSFNSNEMALIEELEDFKFLEVLSIPEIVDYIGRKDEKIYGFVKTYLKRGYSKLDPMLEQRGQMDIKIAIKEQYGKILGRIEEGIFEYIKREPGKFLLVMEGIEEAIDLANNAEKERARITDLLNHIITERDRKFSDAEAIRLEKEGLEDKLKEIEQELPTRESEKEELLSRFSKLESETAEAMEKYTENLFTYENSLKEIEELQGQLEIREKELKDGIEKYEGKLKEANRRIFETEIGKIEEIKREVKLKVDEVENKRDTFKDEKDELDEKLKAVKRAIEGGEFERSVARDIALSFIEKIDISWDVISGLDDLKNRLKACVVLPFVEKPENVKIEGWRNILLFGPPGTGKTLIAAATSNGLHATFFNVKIEQVLSKYTGESSKILGAIFEVAREKSPSVIFIDEIDSIALSRTAKIDESGVLQTLLTELDGLSSKGSDSFLLFIATTNTPWDIDDAVLSRFEQRICVPLPDERAREGILKNHIEGKGYVFKNYPWPITKTEGYSGRDIKNLCKEAVYNMVMELNPAIYDLASKELEEIKTYQIKVRALAKSDFERAFERVKPATTADLAKRYKEWSNMFGSG